MTEDEMVGWHHRLILCCPLLLPSIFPSIRVFSSESALHIRWPEYWSFSFNISASNEYSGRFPLGWTGWISLQSKGLSGVFSSTTVQKHQSLCAQLSLQSNSHIHTLLRKLGTCICYLYLHKLIWGKMIVPKMKNKMILLGTWCIIHW